jgi:hypothetical protein
VKQALSVEIILGIKFCVILMMALDVQLKWNMLMDSTLKASVIYLTTYWRCRK